MSKLTHKKKEEFLQVLAEGESVKRAAASIGVSRQAIYKLRAVDVEFAAEWNSAVDEGTDILEDEAKRRALAGSDVLLIFLLKGNRPEKYKERQELSGNLTLRTVADLVKQANEPGD